MSDQMLVPLPVEGTQDTIPSFPGYEWIKKLPNKRIYFALFQRWPTITRYNQNHIVTGKFFDRCQRKNEESIVRIFDLIS